jgi:hypothetical protein
MIATREEATGLLGKWFNEHTPLTALFTTAGSPFAAKVSGFVNGVTSNILVSDGTHDPSVRSQNYILVPTLDAHEYLYLEAKDLGLSQEELAFVTQAHGAASLIIVFSNGARLSLFERH